MATRAELIAGIREAMMASARMRLTHPEPWLQHDLTMLQMKALFVLSAGGAARPGAIAEAIGATATGVTGILDRLEERDFVRREQDREDRRALIVRLEPAGQAVVDAIFAGGVEEMTRVISRMSTADLQALNQGFTALVRAMNAEHASNADPTPGKGAKPAANRGTR